MTPHLDLSFRRHPQHGTWLDRRLFRWPYTVSRGFRLEPDRLTLILQTISGAIQANDHLVQRIDIGPHAAARITTQGAMPVYRARAGLSARDDITLDIAEHGSIEYTPDLRILFPDSSLSQRIRLRLAESATAIIADGFVMHDPDGNQKPFRDYRSEFRLQRPDGTLLALDRTALLAPPHQRGHYAAFGTLIVAVVQPSAQQQAFCANLDTLLGQLPDIYAAASPLPNGAGVAVRIAAHDGRHLRLGLQAGWSVARQHLADLTTTPSSGMSSGSREHPAESAQTRPLWGDERP